MGQVEGLADLLDLAPGFFGSEVDRRPDSGRAHVRRLFDLGEHDLVERVGVGEQFVVVQLYEKRDFVSVSARDGTECAEG